MISAGIQLGSVGHELTHWVQSLHASVGSWHGPSLLQSFHTRVSAFSVILLSTELLFRSFSLYLLQLYLIFPEVEGPQITFRYHRCGFCVVPHTTSPPPNKGLLLSHQNPPLCWDLIRSPDTWTFPLLYLIYIYGAMYVCFMYTCTYAW